MEVGGGRGRVNEGEGGWRIGEWVRGRREKLGRKREERREKVEGLRNRCERSRERRERVGGKMEEWV